MRRYGGRAARHSAQPSKTICVPMVMTMKSPKNIAPSRMPAAVRVERRTTTASSFGAEPESTSQTAHHGRRVPFAISTARRGRSRCRDFLFRVFFFVERAQRTGYYSGVRALKSLLLAVGLPVLAAVAGTTPVAVERATPAAGGMGILNLAGGGVDRISLNGPLTTNLLHPEGALSLPAGQYSGTAWLNTAAPSNALTCNLYGIRVPSGGRTELKIGPPLTPKVEVTAEGQLLLLSFNIHDADGKSWTPQDRTHKPHFKILKDGREIASGDFEYG